jgi:hypothetical protein
MGLDMYLSKKTYVKNWDHYSPEEVNEITVKKGGQPHPDIKAERVSYIVEQVGYWRKFNALHQWFVDNCQNGVDECQESYVSEEQLKELLEEVLIPIHEAFKSGDIDNANQIAQDLLPTQGGFFFGGLEYNEYYFKDIENTIEILKGLVEEGGDFYYQSSW